ncbi:MAG: extensin family protein [Zoogloeaceae bacterium]|nr:extensin family protein [Zoogloeaceae bacterium]
MRTLACLLLAAALLAWSHGKYWRLPDRHNPWAPLTIEERPGWLTRYKLGRLDDEPEQCLALLASAEMHFEPLPDRTTGPGCVFSNAVRVSRTQVQIGAPFSLSCPAAVSLALWEQHVLQPEARRVLGASVQRLEHYGSYACRNVYGREDGRLSQHATANALDLAGFVLADGRRITVARHWPGNGAEADFLQAIHRGACRFFNGVMGPEYNLAHADHLHLDRGPYRVCR